MASAPPKAINAFVSGTIKEKVLADIGSEKLDTPFVALFKMELVQRGVLVTLRDDDISNWEVGKTLDTVRSSIGKVVQEAGGSLPTPLLAASAVMAGRTAELCASVCSKATTPVLFDVQSALERCKEVSDPRFQVLLELFVEKKVGGDWVSHQVVGLRLIAEGYYLRGASLQPETPQIWKKVYETILVRHNQQDDDVPPGDAAIVLTNMSRIANSKGNTKRAAELSVKATSGYLQMPNAHVTPATNETTFVAAVVKAFVLPHKTVIDNPLKEAEVSVAYSQRQEQLLSPSDVFVVKVLKVQLELAKEDSSIEEQYQHQYQQAQRVSIDNKPSKAKGSISTPSTSKPPSPETIRGKARDRVLVEGDQQQILQGAATKLRDAYLAQENCTPARRQRAAQVLTQVLERSRDRARALMLHKNSNITGWTALTSFVIPFVELDLLSHPRREVMKSFSEDEVKLAETIYTLLPCLPWNQGNQGDFPDYLIPVATEVLEILMEQAQEYQASSNVLISSTEDTKIRQLECAHASVQAWWNLKQIWVCNDTADWKGHSELATAMAQRADKYQQFSMQDGSAFGNFLVAWSGLSQSPWSFCTAPEARVVLKCAKESLTAAQSDCGRPIMEVEQLVVNLAKADMECGILSGGFASEASKIYQSILDKIEALSFDVGVAFRTLLESHCWIGLTRIAFYGGFQLGEEADPTILARKSLEALTSINLVEKEMVPSTFFSIPLTMCFKYHITVSRQLVADALVRSGQAPEAKVFLEDAVRESPKDADASFSLGGFLLRQEFQSPTTVTQSDANTAKMQLLLAAKLDSRKAGPFALLGVWYENQKDLKRALGCYSKALLLEPPHPVAGRGVLRLSSFEAAQSLVQAATLSGSPLAGWAWRALGKHKVMVTGENELGSLALLKALRCRDIEQPHSEALSPFFCISSSPSHQYLGKEKADCWSELAFCYRRLGRYTAAIRSYYSSVEAAGEHVEASVLCACAEVELELGLAEEAAEKFHRALKICDSFVQPIADNNDDIWKPIAAYGLARSLLSLAQRDAQDGKAGNAMHYIQRAIEGLETLTNTFGCTHKLLGDIFSFGAALPPEVFVDSSNKEGILNQISFVKEGEACYHSALEYFAGISENKAEMKLLQGAMITDAGANLLLLAQLTAFYHQGKSSDTKNTNQQSNAVSNLYERALIEFRRAVELCSDYAPAWCGIGCATVCSDPFLAQHAFCRSLQLDSLSPDAYSNLGFLYTSHKSFDASKGVLDALTQVADSPMMWINRALILERSAASNSESGEDAKAQESISQAADAYRAALQVVKHPNAMLGLALTCRASASSNLSREATSVQESHGYLQQYIGKTSFFDFERGGSDEGDTAEGEKTFVADLAPQFGSSQYGKATIDVGLIKKCLLSSEGYSRDENDTAAFPELSLVRQIVHEPHRGDLWVTMAKSLLRDGGGSKACLQSASVASSRAVMILTHQPSFPKLQANTHGRQWVANDKDLSEALSLKYWLGYLKKEENRKEAPSSKVLELQKALMICPTNIFAREVLTNAVASESITE